MYPDVVAVCPRPESKATFTREPLIVVEVLSASTFKHDLSQKRRAYQSIPSLKAYLIVDQDDRGITLFLRHYPPLSDSANTGSCMITPVSLPGREYSTILSLMYTGLMAINHILLTA